jgi:hypothetical protein
VPAAAARGLGEVEAGAEQLAQGGAERAVALRLDGVERGEHVVGERVQLGGRDLGQQPQRPQLALRAHAPAGVERLRGAQRLLRGGDALVQVGGGVQLPADAHVDVRARGDQHARHLRRHALVAVGGDGRDRQADAAPLDGYGRRRGRLHARGEHARARLLPAPEHHDVAFLRLPAERAGPAAHGIGLERARQQVLDEPLAQARVGVDGLLPVQDLERRAVGAVLDHGEVDGLGRAREPRHQAAELHGAGADRPRHPAVVGDRRLARGHPQPRGRDRRGALAVGPGRGGEDQAVAAHHRHLGVGQVGHDVGERVQLAAAEHEVAELLADRRRLAQLARLAGHQRLERAGEDLGEVRGVGQLDQRQPALRRRLDQALGGRAEAAAARGHGGDGAVVEAGQQLLGTGRRAAEGAVGGEHQVPAPGEQRGRDLHHVDVRDLAVGAAVAGGRARAGEGRQLEQVGHPQAAAARQHGAL